MTESRWRDRIMSKLEHIRNQDVPHSWKLEPKFQGNIIRRLRGIEADIQQLTSNIEGRSTTLCGLPGESPTAIG